ncbi:hypothetical protein [Magnetospira sp. QH-2]|uniref:hypothetical protein n=1 Tax=Magnetospira sp. (strain QH-2) TaxID=1288970 RepID=UPI0003E810F1|nr:hypothetical protein [Magnetospira sp. QH-2]CCQ74297.1 Exported protein of unknown function [Magnetospira sp. QH-2]
MNGFVVIAVLAMSLATTIAQARDLEPSESRLVFPRSFHMEFDQVVYSRINSVGPAQHESWAFKNAELVLETLPDSWHTPEDETTHGEFLKTVSQWENLKQGGIKVPATNIRKATARNRTFLYAFAWDPSKTFRCFISTAHLGIGKLARAPKSPIGILFFYSCAHKDHDRFDKFDNRMLTYMRTIRMK